MVVVHPSQKDHWVGVVEVSQHSQEKRGAGGQDKPMHLHLRKETLLAIKIKSDMHQLILQQNLLSKYSIIEGKPN